MSETPTGPSEHAALIQLTQQACEIAQSAISNAADGLAHGGQPAFNRVRDVEEKLDLIDREMDERVTSAVVRASPAQARELLACMKLTLDLERIGDLVLSFAVRGQAVREKLEMADVEALIKMACVLERMLGDITRAFAGRDVDCAIRVLRADSEIDRLRNLLFVRHTEGGDGCGGQESLQVLFMAQALERAGDHGKNMAEEVCHLVSGHTVRHLLRTMDKPQEQMFLEHLRGQYAGSPTPKLQAG
jgi:phosphate transport system protein